MCFCIETGTNGDCESFPWYISEEPECECWNYVLSNITIWGILATLVFLSFFLPCNQKFRTGYLIDQSSRFWIGIIWFLGLKSFQTNFNFLRNACSSDVFDWELLSFKLGQRCSRDNLVSCRIKGWNLARAGVVYSSGRRQKLTWLSIAQNRRKTEVWIWISNFEPLKDLLPSLQLLVLSTTSSL